MDPIVLIARTGQACFAVHPAVCAAVNALGLLNGKTLQILQRYSPS